MSHNPTTLRHPRTSVRQGSPEYARTVTHYAAPPLDWDGFWIIVVCLCVAAAIGYFFPEFMWLLVTTFS